MGQVKTEPKKAKVGLGSQKSTPQLKSHSQTAPQKQTHIKNKYNNFDQLDGQHPWMQQMPESYMLYSARVLTQGKVGYFNFKLAKEMGLIGKNHPEEYNEELNKKLVETFSLQVINEYDIAHKRRFPKENIKPGKYMATRYLQLQHVDKTGKTSGDGRSIWNGSFEHNGTVWDVSSRGTGVTALAPGFVQAGRPLKSGSEEFGYGCGMAEIDELYSTAVMSEIFHTQGIETERMLAIIDLGKGLGIGVRAGKNLIRPAHIFNHLKQSNHDALSRGIDYLVDRQYKNKEWSFSKKHPRKYEKLVDQVCDSYARFAAYLDVDYIFAWLDWDGDNLLANAGIIDYGSIRQFGLRYDQYRYDDVERFSTTLNEQKNKTQQIVQVFAQAADYAKSGKKQSIQQYKDHPITRQFQKKFDEYRLHRILYRVGFDDNNTKYLLSDHRKAVLSFAEEYDFLERKKGSEPVKEVADGVNRQALFNIRKILSELPRVYATAQNFETTLMPNDEFYQTLFAQETAEEEQKLSSQLRQRAEAFQKKYKDLVRKSKRRRSMQRVLTDLALRAEKINSSTRMTGNGIIEVIHELLTEKKKGASADKVYDLMQGLVQTQQFCPDTSAEKFRRKRKDGSEKVFKNMLRLIEEHDEDL